MNRSAQTPMPGPTISPAGYDVSPLSEEVIKELAMALNSEERRVLLHHGTEPAFCGTLLSEGKEGTYVCRLCGLPLFVSNAKFDSGTGWPSFDQPLDRAHIAYVEDRSHGMTRTEIRCARCGGHLGHVFPDGPVPTRERYCLNSVSMEFVEAGRPLPSRSGIKRDQPRAP